MNTKTRLALAASLAISSWAASADAQESEDRFALERTDDGYVRLDRQTGEMSICRTEGGDLICRMAADERAAFETELDSLSDRVAALERRVGEGTRSLSDLPTDEELDRTMGIMETFMRRFFSIIEDLNRDFGLGDNAEDPTRT